MRRKNPLILVSILACCVFLFTGCSMILNDGGFDSTSSETNSSSDSTSSTTDDSSDSTSSSTDGSSDSTSYEFTTPDWLQGSWSNSLYYEAEGQPLTYFTITEHEIYLSYSDESPVGLSTVSSVESESETDTDTVSTYTLKLLSDTDGSEYTYTWSVYATDTSTMYWLWVDESLESTFTKVE